MCAYVPVFVGPPELSITGACCVINSTSTREQINAGCNVMHGPERSTDGWRTHKEKKAERKGREVGKCEKENK